MPLMPPPIRSLRHLPRARRRRRVRSGSVRAQSPTRSPARHLDGSPEFRAPSREIGAPIREIGAPSREVVSGRPLRPARRVSSTACLRVAPERRRPLVHRPDRRSRALRFGCPRAQSHCHVDGAVPSSTSSAADVLAAARRNRHGRRSRRRLGAQLGAQTLRVAGKL